jgi:hypothetical protein
LGVVRPGTPGPKRRASAAPEQVPEKYIENELILRIKEKTAPPMAKKVGATGLSVIARPLGNRRPNGYPPALSGGVERNASEVADQRLKRS